MFHNLWQLHNHLSRSGRCLAECPWFGIFAATLPVRGTPLSGFGGVLSARFSASSRRFAISVSLPLAFLMDPVSAKTEVGFDARWLWVNVRGALTRNAIYNFSLSELGITIQPTLGYPQLQLKELVHLGIPTNTGPFEYHPANRCIYCDATEYASGSDRDFGGEHIVAEALGSPVLLPRASCQRHECITAGIESRVLQRLFDPTRKQRDIRGKKPLLKGKFSVFRTIDGKSIGAPLPIGNHPTTLFLPRLGTPGILSGRPDWMHGVSGLFLVNLNAHADTLNRQRITSYSTPSVDTIALAQLFAKIGHAYASAEVLAENFEPMLLDFIELKLKNVANENFRYQFWGGDESPLSPTPYLHELGLGLAQSKSKLYLVARIRLFAFLGAPAYYVVVGAVPDDKRSAVMARLSQNNSRTHMR
ncbi:MAG: hypothetical protein ACRECF_01325 [Methyloceanibacter sp.]